MKLNSLIIFILFVSFGFLSYSQDKLPPKLKFNSIRVEDGLPNNIINSIVQDSLGFIWIGTNDGLGRYDGENYKLFRQSPNKKNSISNNFIQSLHVDSNGDLWVMTDQGLNKYDIKKELFEIYLTDNSNLSHNSVTTIEERNKGEFYVGTYGGGIDILKEGKFIFNFNINSENSISSNLISSLQIQNDSVLWVGTYDNGINKIDLNSKNVTKLEYGNDAVTTSEIINSIYLDSSNYLWIGTKFGLTVYNSKTDKFFKINSENCTSFLDDDILSIFEDNDRIIWLGTRNSGIIRQKRLDIIKNKNNTLFNNYQPNNSNESVTYRSISSFYQDKQSNIWIGTHLEGVNVVNTTGEKIRLYNHFETEEVQINNQSIWGICEDSKNNIWLGTDGNGLLKFNPFTNKTESFVFNASNKNSINDNAIISSCFDSNGNLWIGTYAGGINKLERNSTKFKHYIKGIQNNQLNSNDIRVIYEDHKKRIWIGTNGGGLHLYKPDTDDFEFITQVGWLDVRSITEDSNGNLWLGTFGNGILSYNYEENISINYPKYDDLNAHIVFSIKFTSQNDLWIGTRFKGLIHFNIETQKINQFTQSDGLSNNTIQSIVVENSNHLWLSTNEGINSFNVSSKKFDSYKNPSGVQTGPFNNNSGFLSKNGYIVFGGINGLNIFYPNDLKKDKDPLKIIFTNLKLFNETVEISNDFVETPLKHSISNTSEIKLKHNQDVITLEYAALNFPSSKGINYEYILENYDNHWSKVGSLSSATYRNLAPGEYIFKVKVSDEAGNWNSQSTNLKITISPPFWLTVPAILIYIILISLLAFIIMRYYTDQIKLKNSLFYAQKIREQETDLNKERFRFFTNFSHELRTPLTLILGPITDVLREEKNGKNIGKLTLIKRNAQILLELINKMLEFRKSETEHNHLEIGQYSFTKFVQEICDNFKFYAKQKEIEFNIQFDKDYIAWFDYKKIQLVLFNLLSNAFKYTGKTGKINVIIEEQQDTLLLHITDTGVGIKQEALNSVFNLYYHKDFTDTIEGTGIGLALCKKLMDLHSAQILVKSEVGVGSEFTIELFKNKEHFLRMNNIEFVETEEFVIKKPFINDPILNYKEHVEVDLNEDDKVVLIVDDNLDVVNYVSDILSKFYKVITAKNGKIGVEKAMQFIPNLIISDVMMPEKSGIDLCTELKNYSQTSHIPIILLTAKLGEKDKLEAMKIGADDYITKPFDSEYLLTRIENLFKNRKKLVSYYNNTPSENLKEEKKSVEDKFLEKLEKLIIEKYNGNEISIPEIAQELGFSRSSLYRKIKAVTGSPINHFVKRVRLNKAAKLILEGESNVSEAAFESGFNDLKYFRTCFKEQFGITPSKYKGSLSAKNESV